MSTWVIVGIVVALGVCAAGIQVLATALRTTPVDAHPAGLLFERPRPVDTVAPPPSLSTMEQLVEDALYSDAVAEQRLWPLIVTLARSQRADLSALRPPSGDTRAWLEEMLRVISRPA